MKIIGVNGSPHQDGNTALMLTKALEGAKNEGAEVELINIATALEELEVPFCEHCSSPCAKVCYQGTLVEDYLELLGAADGVIIGSPVYFGTVSGQLKSFWDLTRALRSEKSLTNTVGGALAVGASRFGGQETTVRALQDMMMVQGMIVVGDGTVEDGAGHQGACGQMEVKIDQQAQQQAMVLGKRVARVAKK
ncbi:flavodoxin family protein [Natroniella sulfidigena]|uniref:flavodoxin family protein n=1 Tax=Natroniella sulfidigena TaxID=723921 RepID=UPI00200AD4E0|nr:flavodoxin family protein [Natroniella sulfidigena]MCK8815945.1 flavodoxin family protein [Natroniella sulfidigena]